MNDIIQIIVTVVCSVLASQGLWAFLTKHTDRKDAKCAMLIGLAHDRILTLGMHYLSRGDWITRDEYENLYEYLYKPYKEMGGNGSAQRVMAEIDSKLKIVAHPPINDTEENNDENQ